MVRVPLMEKKAGNGAASCAVKKDAGDDPDVTDGLLIFAQPGSCRKTQGMPGRRTMEPELLLPGNAG